MLRSIVDEHAGKTVSKCDCIDDCGCKRFEWLQEIRRRLVIVPNRNESQNAGFLCHPPEIPKSTLARPVPLPPIRREREA